MSAMCPYCGVLVKAWNGMAAGHALPPVYDECPGSGENVRCAESDARPLWNGKPNPHFAGRTTGVPTAGRTD